MVARRAREAPVLLMGDIALGERRGGADLGEHQILCNLDGDLRTDETREMADEYMPWSRGIHVPRDDK